MAVNLTEKSKDRRIARTRQAIRMALFRLIGSYDWQDISISKLCHEADVARSTFYLHYASPTEVLDESISEIVAAFSVDSTSTIPVLEWLVDHVAANGQFFSARPMVPRPTLSSTASRRGSWLPLRWNKAGLTTRLRASGLR